METNTSGDIPASYLLIDSVAPSDSGKYSCHPANAQEVGVNVHIQDGKLFKNICSSLTEAVTDLSLIKKTRFVTAIEASQRTWESKCLEN